VSQFDFGKLNAINLFYKYSTPYWGQRTLANQQSIQQRLQITTRTLQLIWCSAGSSSRLSRQWQSII